MQVENTNKSHVHAELIKQWADGAEIQAWDSTAVDWYDICTPLWSVSQKYRVKPRVNIKNIEVYAIMRYNELFISNKNVLNECTLMNIKYNFDTGKILDIK